LEDIESVKEKASGIFSSFFGYGDVFIKTAAETINIDFLSVPRPTHVRNIIADLSGFSRRLFKKDR
jgi:hypothetical protein